MMLSAPNNALNVSHVDHLSSSYRNKRSSSTSRLATWHQIRPMIYSSMLCGDKSNSQWIQKQLSSFEVLLREEYPKDVVPNIMDDHIRSVLSKHPDALHKSILKMLFIKIPKLKPDTIFFIPSSPKQSKRITISKHSARNNSNLYKHSLSSVINKQSSESSSSDGEQNDGSVIISAHHHKDTLSIKLNPAPLAAHVSDSNSHQYASSFSDSNQVFLPRFKPPVTINLTESDPENHKTARDALGLSPSESSKVQGYDYHDEEANTDDDIKMDDEPETKCSEQSEIDAYHTYAYTNDDHDTRDSTASNAKHAQKASRSSIFNKILKNRNSINHKESIMEQEDDRNRVLSQSIASTTQHLAKRISDIQNRHITQFVPEEADHSINSGSSRPSTVHEIDFMVNIKSGKATPYIKSPYISSLLYIIIYVFNSLHLLTSIWLLLNLTMFCFNTKVPIFLQMFLYFNISMLCVLELWKLFAGILFHIKSDNYPTIKKLNSCQKWRLQFWIFLPLIWCQGKASFHMFFMMNPISIEIWFDLCVHHIWMFLLCILFFIYPYLYGNVPGIDFVSFISCGLYIITFCVILTITLCIKSRHNLQKT